MSNKSLISNSFDSISTLNGNPCKCIQQIIRESYGEGSDVVPDTKIQEDQCVQYLCGSSSKSQVSRSSNLGETTESLDEKLKRSLSEDADDRKVSNSFYTAEEIKEFTRIIHDAIYNEIRRKMPESGKLSSEKQSKLSMGNFHEDDFCWCSDNLTLHEMKSRVHDQLALMCEYQVGLFPDQIALNNENLLQYVREESMTSDESKSDDVQLENQKFDVHGSLDHQVSVHNECRKYSDLQLQIENKSNLSVCTKNQKNSKIGKNNETNACGKIIKMCKSRAVPIRLNFNKYLDHLDCEDVEPFTIGSQGRSDLIGKWGECHDIVNKVLSERNNGTGGKMISEKVPSASEQFNDLGKERTLNCIHYDDHEDEYLLVDVCGMDKQCISHDNICNQYVKEAEYDDNQEAGCNSRSHTCREIFHGVCVSAVDVFDNLKRFDVIGNRGVASLCRTLTKWTHCVTKTLCEIRKHPHLVIQMPSFSYPKSLRIRAAKAFKTLQNIQFGRLAWIGNENAQVLYVFPNLENGDELPNLLRELVSRVRPDINLDNLWFIRSRNIEQSRYAEDKVCASGTENLFADPLTYRRVRNLTAGRQAFILPGLMDEKDVFVACELKLPIIGVSLKCQNCFKLKSEFIKILREFDINHPPSLDVEDFHGLCKGFVKMIIEFPIHHKWLVKINIGFHGFQTAVVNFETTLLNSVFRDKSRCALEMEEKWTSVFMKILPTELQFNRDVYQNYREFIYDLEYYGGIIQACPECKYKPISLGIAIEHDTASPNLLTTAEVVQFKDDIRNDIGYVIPQTTVCEKKLEELTRRIGMALCREGLVGFFGIDLVAFINKSNEQELWVVDLDPHYTDLQAFSDWIKFCLKFGEPCDSMRPTNQNATRENVWEKLPSMLELEKELPNKRARYAIASGKLWSNGLSEYSANTLINLCRDRYVHYDHLELRGCMICPIDPEFRAICLISIYPTRQLAIRKFVEALKILHELSNNKRKCIETNLLVVGLSPDALEFYFTCMCCLYVHLEIYMDSPHVDSSPKRRLIGCLNTVRAGLGSLFGNVSNRIRIKSFDSISYLDFRECSPAIAAFFTAK